MVSGGVGEGDQLLDSVEFFSLGEERTWRELSPLKVPRTEHGKNKKYLSLSSYEKLDIVRSMDDNIESFSKMK